MQGSDRIYLLPGQWIRRRGVAYLAIYLATKFPYAALIYGMLRILGNFGKKNRLNDNNNWNYIDKFLYAWEAVYRVPFLGHPISAVQTRFSVFATFGRRLSNSARFVYLVGVFETFQGSLSATFLNSVFHLIQSVESNRKSLG